MAKRSRAAARPGQMRPARRPQKPAGTGAAAPATDAPRSPVATPVTEPVDTDRDLDLPAADDRVSRRRDRARAEAAGAVRARSTQASGLLAARAAQEYGYVARDVRHIAAVGGGLFGALVALWLVIEVLHLVTL
jgi:hypothetical protein